MTTADSGDTMSAVVRSAAENDVDGLARMHQAAVIETLESRGGSNLVATLGRGDLADTRATFGAEMDDPLADVLVAALETKYATGESGPTIQAVLGYCVVRWPGADPSDSGSAGNTIALIAELWVEPEARRIGLGTELLEHAADLAERRGCTGLDSIVLPGDRATKNFFEDHSMVARAILVHRRLAPRGQDRPV